jgi:hypothetical protein
MTRVFVPGLMLLVLLALVGCSGISSSYVGESQNYTVRLRLDSATVGDRIVTLDVRDRAGQGTLLQKVVVVPMFRATGAASPEVTAVPQANDQYQAGPVVLNQAGEWNLVIRISGATGVEEATVVVQVQE